jgi:hypothetical protein
MTRVAAVMIAYNNEDTSLTRLHRDLLPALTLLEYAHVIVIDNSAAESDRLVDALLHCGFDFDYRWQRGANLWYGPSINLAVKVSTQPYLLYVCTNHGEAFDPTWARDLLEPFAD